ncbi:glycosyltransferase family 2 protein [Thermodesulfatator atlanticus]|uniref:glycosyltransferase family 2 protein n=1 Tax=Thermodesulfatator atlanticus TaxID=501497 RepID=UPI0004050FFA|nr:glycosyltransferase family 2 protein [Thermodesulfatator atlanticus]
MKNTLLSICIPTYNRGNFLNETIESVVLQITDDIKDKVELCISDNASTDNTDEIIEKWKKKSPIHIVYHKNEENLGPDRNYLKVIEIANGKYCWLLGSDDKLKEGSIERILNELKEECDIYLCNRIDCDFNMRPVRVSYFLDRKVNDKVFDFLNKEDFKFYLKNARLLESFFTYLSSVIFLKDKWDKVLLDSRFIGTGYPHVFKLMSFFYLDSNFKVKYIKEPLVFFRSGNDSFLEGRGVVGRFLLDLNAWEMLADNFLKEEDYRKLFLRVFLSHYRWMNILKILAYVYRDVSKEYNDKDIIRKVEGFGLNKYFLCFLALCAKILSYKIDFLVTLKKKLIKMSFLIIF